MVPRVDKGGLDIVGLAAERMKGDEERLKNRI